jgi:hypothetical protein
MVNPVLTILFDAFVIGGTLALFALALAESRLERRGVAARRPFRRHAAHPRAHARIGHRPSCASRKVAA